MKRRYGCLALAACLLMGSTVTVQAEEYTTSGWKTQYADGKMTTNFDSSDVASTVSGLLPGDSVTVELTLENQDRKSTDWYMTNEVISSLEDSQEAAGGGAYGYNLTYTDSAGEVTVLYSSENVGGEKSSETGEGLHEASRTDFFYLDRLDSGTSGKVSLTIRLDGETNGNGYQNTLARLQMAFAADPVTGGSGGRSGGSGGGTGNNGASAEPASAASVAYTLGGVQTGDANDLVIWSVVALISGLVLLVWAVLCYRKDRGGEEHA